MNNLLGALDASTRLTLVNAIYFRAIWEIPFHKRSTEVQPFHLGFKNIKVDVKMMHTNGNFKTGLISSLDARVLELPFKVGYKEFFGKINFFLK